MHDYFISNYDNYIPYLHHKIKNQYYSAITWNFQLLLPMKIYTETQQEYGNTTTGEKINFFN